jgi:putative intracellular protease/amidase
MKKLIILLCLQPLCLFAQTRKKILIVATSADNLINKPNNHTWGCYTPEITEFYARIYQAGYRIDDIDLVTSKGGVVPQAVGPSYPKKFILPEDEKKALEAKMQKALSPAQVVPERYGVIYYSGGFSCLVDYPNAEGIANIASAIYKQGGIVAAVCDGVCGLLPIKINEQYIISGKNISSNGDLKGRLRERGAIISDDKLSSDRGLITAKGVHPVSVAEEVLRLLGK